jgi:phage tail protein X
MIDPGSRYATSTVVGIDKADGTSISTIVPSPPVVYTFTYSPYQFTGADRIDNLANTFYGSPQAWWSIADANPEILDWSNVAPGTIIRIPDLV